MNLESMLLVGRMVGLLEEAVMPSPYSADLRERVLWLMRPVCRRRWSPRLWGRALDGISVAPAGARGGAALCRAAWRRAGTGD